MSLATYKSKRNFKDTPEPKGKLSKNKVVSFGVQRHDASHLHYDFRLEMDGVLKSWAVPKGPSMNPKDKRLAVMVEDHPFDYLKFEGSIPEGNYGAGSVELWDVGTYELIKSGAGDTGLKQIEKGNLKVTLHGKKLKGEFALVRINDGKDKNWLLIKHKDDFAVDTYNAEDYSKKIPKAKKAVSKAASKKTTVPAIDEDTVMIPSGSRRSRFDYKNATALTKKQSLHNPMLAYLSESIPAAEDFFFEEKYDGYRAIAQIEKGNAIIYSRNHKSFDDRFSIIVEELKKVQHNAVLDGELVVLNASSNKAGFEEIQNVDTADPKHLRYILFDILSLDNNDLTELPIEQRKELLSLLFKKIKSKHILLSPSYEDGQKLFKQAQKDHWEGIIAKKKESIYLEATRSRDWLKIKINDTQDAIICGYTQPQGERKKFGSLILGMYVKDKLTYIGNCGTGFNQETLSSVFKLLQSRISITKPFDEKVEGTAAAITWVRPELVCEVKYSEWTSRKHLRHPVFMRIRDDKDAEDTSKEAVIEAVVNKNASKKTPVAKKAVKKPVSKKTPLAKASSKKVIEKSLATTSVKQTNTKKPSGKKTTSESENTKELKLGKITLNFTNLNKIYWPKEKITKGSLINYYDSVSDVILPHLQNRPLSLNRFPNGIAGPSFYQKDIDIQKSPAWLKTIEVFSESNQATIDYLVCNDKATLLYMANLGCIEMNPWLSRTTKLENPDFLVLDLDPGKIGFAKVIDTAQACKEVFDSLGIQSFIKTSGSTGLHIFIYLNAKYNYDISKTLAELISQRVHAMLPSFTSIERAVSKRPDKIYIDFLQNRRGQTIASAFSCRPKPGATVSFPLTWKEVTHDLKMTDYTIFNVPDIIQSSWKDPWTDIKQHEVNVKKVIELLEK
ncbi:MAG: DNA ligase D [Cytophagales bacterium]|nr:DNA ligase D [Cytophaga sp.]